MCLSRGVMGDACTTEQRNGTTLKVEMAGDLGDPSSQGHGPLYEQCRVQPSHGLPKVR